MTHLLPSHNRFVKLLVKNGSVCHRGFRITKFGPWLWLVSPASAMSCTKNTLKLSLRGHFLHPSFLGCPFWNHQTDFTSPSAWQFDTRSDLHLSDPLKWWRQNLRETTPGLWEKQVWMAPHPALFFGEELHSFQCLLINLCQDKVEHHVEIWKCWPCLCTKVTLKPWNLKSSARCFCRGKSTVSKTFPS